MARYGASQESQTAQTSGAPSGTTVNGYMCALVAGASFGFKVRRLTLGCRAGTSAVADQQMVVGLFPQTVRAAGTGLSTVTGVPFDTNTATQITGLDYTTATTLGTNGPTLGANPMKRLTFNTKAAYDVPMEMLEELYRIAGTANGIALVLLDNALPASTVMTFDWEWEE